MLMGRSKNISRCSQVVPFFFFHLRKHKEKQETFPPDVNEAFFVLGVARFLCTADQAAESIQGEGMRQLSLCENIHWHSFVGDGSVLVLWIGCLGKKCRMQDLCLV